MRTGFIDIRVRYAECDPMGVAHHSAYAPWFEMGRTELLRSDGVAYRELESKGILLAVVELLIKYRRAARYDDVLRLQTRLIETSQVKIIHEYTLQREGEVLAVGRSVLACVTRDGRAQGLPEILQRHAAGTLESPPDLDHT